MQRYTKGILYVFKVVGDDVYKIGFTTKEDPSTGRLPGVQTGNHKDLKLVHMWSATYGEEQDLHHALSPYRSRDSGKGEWYCLTVGVLVEAISKTGQALVTPEVTTSPSLSDVDDYFEPSHVMINEGPYEGLQGFASSLEPYPISNIPKPYQSVAVENHDIDEEGNITACEVYLMDLDTTVWLPPCVIMRSE